jgi:hypothetical protein
MINWKRCKNSNFQTQSIGFEYGSVVELIPYISEVMRSFPSTANTHTHMPHNNPNFAFVEKTLLC